MVRNTSTLLPGKWEASPKRNKREKKEGKQSFLRKALRKVVTFL